MMRALVVVVAVVGCAQPDPCAEVSETCVAVEVHGAFADLDVLEVSAAAEGRTLRGRVQPATPGSFALPVQFAAMLPSVSAGRVALDVIALRGGAPVARGGKSLTVPPRSQRVRVDVTAFSGAIDLAPPDDLSSSD